MIKVITNKILHLSKIITILFCFIILNVYSFSEEIESEYYEIGRKILKEYTLCQCVNSSMNSQLDASSNLILSNTSYDFYVVKRINQIIGTMFEHSKQSVVIDNQSFSLNNYYCMKLYESKYLDSLVTSFDIYLSKKDDPKILLSRYKLDSNQFEKLLDSIMEPKND